ncbi:MAG: helix-turn-helix domain-containing protein [Leptospira sp.]|nr:helix-turn-helix domain-containing protein [Leptospira sp.]
MSDYHPYIRFMTDIIDSGVWANLSSAAKTLYPVLLKFSDSKFKPVWPGTETLLGLTGFKTKKSIVQAKKELTKAGLLYQVPGSGKTATRYHFSFHYEGSKITPLGDTNIPHGGIRFDQAGGDQNPDKGVTGISPNHINITISNTNQLDPKGNLNPKQEEKTSSLEELVSLFGTDIAFSCYSHASSLQLEKDMNYLLGLCKEKVMQKNGKLTKFEQIKTDEVQVTHPASWLGFLGWASQQLSHTTWKDLEKIEIHLDGKVLLIISPVSGFAKQIIHKYFTEKVSPKLVVIFQEKEEESRLSEIR